jgi:SAM-dependent methyltransferase
MEPTQRFSDRVDDYTKYRPGYPSACLEYIIQTFGITSRTSIADVGSGTGIFTKLLLETGATVCAIEPNDKMRAEAEKQLGIHSKFISLKGSGEATHLARSSVHLVTVAQAFHWMDPAVAKKEFHRILKPGGHIALLWNIKTTDTRFSLKYEQLKEKYGRDYLSIRKSHEPDLKKFFLPKMNVLAKFPHFVLLDEEGLQGQIRSSSFMPTPKDADYEAMTEEMSLLFHQHQENGLLRVDYETQLHHD